MNIYQFIIYDFDYDNTILLSHTDLYSKNEFHEICSNAMIEAACNRINSDYVKNLRTFTCEDNSSYINACDEDGYEDNDVLLNDNLYSDAISILESRGFTRINNTIDFNVYRYDHQVLNVQDELQKYLTTNTETHS